MNEPAAPARPGGPPVVLFSLAAVADAPPSRARVVASTRGEGRELLRALARLRGRWFGLDVTTPRPLALEVVGTELAVDGWTLLDEFAEQALLDELLDVVLETGSAAPRLRELAEGVGFRRVVREAVSALRLAGVGSERVARASFADSARQHLLGGLLRRYEDRLERRRLADTADVLARAAAHVEGGAPLPEGRILLLPGLGRRGVAGRFLASLEARGAERLAGDPVRGIALPPGLLWTEAGVPGDLGHVHDVEGWLDAGGTPPGQDALAVFRAGGITEELREVLRRVLDTGLRWDEVEIVTPDPAVYGPALHGLASRLAIPVTFAVGLPVERTRPGRAVAAWLRWIREDFPDAVLRGLLAAGDLAPPAAFRDVDGPRLARRLRRLRIGWGRERYLAAVDSATTRLAAEGLRPGQDEGPEQAERRHRRGLRELKALRALLGPLLDAVPAVPGRLDPSPVAVAPADLARGLARFLGAVPPRGTVDETARERLVRILERIESTLSRPTSFAAAVTILEEHLAIRVPAPRAEGRAPWGSAGGHLHLSDVEHGGHSGRSNTFIVGLDAGRFPGAVRQDPLLLDDERAALAPRDLPRSRDRLHERRFRMAALLARLRGRVTLSWAAWDPSEARVLSPSALVLQAYRLLSGDPDAAFRDLERHVGDPLSRIPRGEGRLDDEDVWLGALARDGRLLAGEDVVRAAYTTLDAGLRARAGRLGSPSAHHGMVEPRPGLDPREEPRPVLSATRLEALGTCPLRYLYRYVLGAAPPEDPTFEPERWLDPQRRGSLLHTVYERVLNAARRDELPYDDPRLTERADAFLRDEARAQREALPPPSEAVYERELAALALDVRSFLGMLALDPPEWVETELRFGHNDSFLPAVELGLPGGGRVLLRGAIDRVDRLRSGGLRVVDYKTGAARRFTTGGTWAGGRRLQHALYSSAAEELLGSRVDRMEYHFPTRKGENERVRFPRAALEGGPRLLERLLEVAASGRYLPTDDPEDCRRCEFRGVCRVRVTQAGKVASPLARWAQERLDTEPFDLLRAVRRVEEGG